MARAKLGDSITAANGYQPLVSAALGFVIEHILSGNPACRLNLWTPLQRDKDGYDVDRPNGLGHRLDDYAEAVRRLGRSYALPVLDLYAESGLNRLTLSAFTVDGLHPNPQGHARIASMAVSFLERL